MDLSTEKEKDVFGWFQEKQKSHKTFFVSPFEKIKILVY